MTLSQPFGTKSVHVGMPGKMPENLDVWLPYLGKKKEIFQLSFKSGHYVFMSLWVYAVGLEECCNPKGFFLMKPSSRSFGC